MQLSRRALFRSILPLSALAASIAASLKSPQAAPLTTTRYGWHEYSAEFFIYEQQHPRPNGILLGIQRPEWWK